MWSSVDPSHTHTVPTHPSLGVWTQVGTGRVKSTPNSFARVLEIRIRVQLLVPRSLLRSRRRKDQSRDQVRTSRDKTVDVLRVKEVTGEWSREGTRVGTLTPRSTGTGEYERESGQGMGHESRLSRTRTDSDGSGRLRVDLGLYSGTGDGRWDGRFPMVGPGPGIDSVGRDTEM